jgi:transcriptional regulator with XRE-family HTH domain
MKLINIKEMKCLRKEMGYKNSQKLAKLLGFGSATISRWECGFSPMSKSHGLMVEAFLKIPSFREFILGKNGIDMMGQGEWIDEGMFEIHPSDLEDVMKYVNEKVELRMTKLKLEGLEKEYHDFIKKSTREIKEISKTITNVH